ncbi:MAG: hypothetical protein QNJ09_13445 [Paracoccaceae bacterium]|nr:hypothetical protein [Paracoccaceae bacterium]
MRLAIIPVPQPSVALPCLAIAIQVLDEFDHITLVASDAFSKELTTIADHHSSQKISVANTVQDAIAPFTNCDVEYIGWYHQLGVPGTIDALRRLHGSARCRNLTLSHMPDGISSFIRRNDTMATLLGHQKQIGFHIGRFFQFFIVSETSLKTLPDTDFQPISIDAFRAAVNTISDALDAVQVLQQEVAAIQAHDPDHLIFLTMRPWSSASFHGGVYDFGTGAETLGFLTAKILNGLDLSTAQKPMLFIKTDNREAKLQFDALSVLSVKTDLPTHVWRSKGQLGNFLTFEIFVWVMKEQIQRAKRTTLVSFDSNTPFPIAALTDRMDFVIGLDEDSLAAAAAKPEQLARIRFLSTRTFDLTLQNMRFQGHPVETLSNNGQYVIKALKAGG